MNREIDNFEPIPDNVELSDEAQRMFDEMDGTFDDENLIDQIKPAK